MESLPYISKIPCSKLQGASILPVTETSEANAGRKKKDFNWYLAEARSSKFDTPAFRVRYALHI
jgi:hypothetical protein